VFPTSKTPAPLPCLRLSQRQAKPSTPLCCTFQHIWLVLWCGAVVWCCAVVLCYGAVVSMGSKSLHTPNLRALKSLSKASHGLGFPLFEIHTALYSIVSQCTVSPLLFLNWGAEHCERKRVESLNLGLVEKRCLRRCIGQYSIL